MERHTIAETIFVSQNLRVTGVVNIANIFLFEILKHYKTCHHIIRLYSQLATP